MSITAIHNAEVEDDRLGDENTDISSAIDDDTFFAFEAHAFNVRTWNHMSLLKDVGTTPHSKAAIKKSICLLIVFLLLSAAPMISMYPSWLEGRT